MSLNQSTLPSFFFFQHTPPEKNTKKAVNKKGGKREDGEGRRHVFFAKCVIIRKDKKKSFIVYVHFRFVGAGNRVGGREEKIFLKGDVEEGMEWSETGSEKKGREI